ncbi:MULTISPECIES: ABC transporter substrate-binding protein [unclassified Gordonia (in: high G+C Gram-positive bacteria)]|uniref:ABC transporter substrate-binding protein n=1 Tax=unclassified Gordonia (in: high G+C Gram-positive bacteria) TaxID=2657482 RepID=UPI00071C9331|nr:MULTISPECIES: ABC transporter substrate-binding protein [unclassified Gordonia (in: high G+C Gram-positive bacteria)]KSU57106.1 ABC transporter substrate-binding protein [Gordonia sp. SGD-V-85]MBR7193050.1 ABC transporter substrate-binding protein [Gordonia sp. SCSIO 19800]
MTHHHLSVRASRARRRRVLAAVLATAALTLGLAGCVQREDTAESIANETVDVASLQDLTLRVGDQKGGTEALLRASGELEKLPFTIEFSTFTSGPPQIEAATAGKIDFAVTGNTPPIFGAAANAKVKIVTGYANNASGDAILIPGTSTLASVADLKGKKVAVAKGSSAHGHLLLQLNKVNLTLGPGKDVEPVFLQPADALSAFTSGNVDAWAIWDPYTAIVQLENNPKTLVTAEGVSNGYGFGIAGDEALADPRRNTAVRELALGIARAANWAKANPEEWAEQYSAEVGIDPRAGAIAQGRSLRPAIALDDSVVASEQELADAFADSGQLQGQVDFAKFVDNRYDEALAPLFGTPQS